MAIEIDTKTRITAQTLEKMNKSNGVKVKMGLAFDKGYHTIQRWINSNDVMLTTADSLRIIQEELHISAEEALENYK